ncbi:MAG TPA: ACP phosphodiesterase, partial [Pantoea agglomerans]|nr:ACP phosphodiesterase [Pantoea agglomerans]
YHDFTQHYDQLEALFFVFYPRLMALATSRTL